MGLNEQGEKQVGSKRYYYEGVYEGCGGICGCI